MVNRAVSLLIFSVLLPGLCLPNVAFAEAEEYRIGREDVLEISVWQSPDLSKTLAVLSDGTVDYPILGKIPAAALTPQELAKSLQEKLAQGYVNAPKVNVTVKEYNSKKILVFGEVEKPGLYKLKGPIPLLELLFMVGGVKEDAKRMTVIRSAINSPDAVPSALLPSTTAEPAQEQETESPMEIDLLALLSKGDLSQNITILPGDTIYVSSGTGKRFYVLGHVGKPGPYEWVQEITVLEAIKLADGNTSKAALARIQVRKNKGEHQEVLKVNVVDIMKGKKKDDVMIEPGDVVVVPERWI